MAMSVKHGAAVTMADMTSRHSRKSVYDYLLLCVRGLRNHNLFTYLFSSKCSLLLPHNSLLPPTISDPNHQIPILMETPLTLGDLPPEVFLLVTDNLERDSHLALKFTCRGIYKFVDLKKGYPQGDLTECAQKAIRAYLKTSKDDKAMVYCRGCKKVYDQVNFTSRKCPPLPHQPPSKDSERVLHVPPRWCNWHIRRIIKTSNEGREGEIKWTSRIGELCFHCNTIKEWHGCKCTCKSCGTERVRVYQRVTSDGSECKKYYFWRDRSRVSEDPTEQAHAPGRLFVREIYDSGDVDYQVEYEDMKQPGP
ncbi:hypothetical protein BU24DRAFT_177797 [Aaosphaeria arxii CBS 175.79]|uniref:F-box domain-containing protein n=1 Tax=Aaosphaeria arxii CBS 175.79 TaxID=1450172 RepID=A0A6A5XRF5_9PLEO|nr:uncharacterized protein BU24DRAFT_177797 [Aaosphaeria arxii CBS 175.79]KAF2015417.1 hypothetical protein BU24DRAFT_177797 [Aaosphaeria arxii CBS 175.79]